MNPAVETIVSLLILVGAAFALLGSIGLARLPDFFTRLHGPTKATTLGVGGALLASVLYSAAFKNNLSLHELLISMFLFLTAPITAHFLAKAHIHRHVDPARELPQADGHGWGTFEAPHDAAAEMKAVMYDGPDPEAVEKAHNGDDGRSSR